ncbi:hypothetical protein FNV43_RR11215 [Rhamnella rubrinervis]|uniref:Protein kinase domain-containing protein n=1 Tax=Rhamnella rubrinervis TaxID=2594499 RepID=A0A8K0H5A2_9ROSA|nr:hypothetical protein FNV43_RR11215 [Rhamnella rubrinervis]
MSRNLRKLMQLGRGSYGIVHLAVPINPTFSTKACAAVKSSMLEHSSILQKEDRVSQLMLVQLSKDRGSLFDMIQSYGRSIPEQKVKIYTRMMLKGLCCIHQKGYVHCDLKPKNIIVFVNDHGVKQLKIADFGMTKEPGREEETNSNEEPELYLPQNMSEKGKDFLRKCLVRDPRKRWTAKMLLNHPFAVEGHTLSLMEQVRCSYNF